MVGREEKREEEGNGGDLWHGGDSCVVRPSRLPLGGFVLSMQSAAVVERSSGAVERRPGVERRRLCTPTYACIDVIAKANDLALRDRHIATCVELPRDLSGSFLLFVIWCRLESNASHP